jgi:hypothetical protein
VAAPKESRRPPTLSRGGVLLRSAETLGRSLDATGRRAHRCPKRCGSRTLHNSVVLGAAGTGHHRLGGPQFGRHASPPAARDVHVRAQRDAFERAAGRCRQRGKPAPAGPFARVSRGANQSSSASAAYSSASGSKSPTRTPPPILDQSSSAQHLRSSHPRGEHNLSLTFFELP